ncbi:MAG: hypothetical protein JKY01_00720 [Pseudomonadales bacterium]|nr:hypothetical protein [Pseudomonadales bacterium]
MPTFLQSKILFLALTLFLSMHASALAYKEQSFEGSLSTVPVPAGWLAEYQQLGDVVVVGDGTTQGFLLSIGPSESPVDYLKKVVKEMDSLVFVNKVKKATIGGYEAAIIDHFGIVHEKYVAVKKSGALLVIYATTKHDPASLNQHLELIASKTKISAKNYPDYLAGNYLVDRKEDLSYEPELTPGLYQEKITLGSNGVFGDLGFDEPVSDLTKNTQEGGYLLGSWVQRGNRLIIEENKNYCVNYRIQASASGLTLVDQDGITTRWVKQ